MILENKGKAMIMSFDHKDFNIPEGKFEVETALGNHIIFISNKWEDTDIVVVEGTKTPEIKPAVERTEAPKENDKKDSPVESKKDAGSGVSIK